MPADGYRCPSCGTQYLQGGWCVACRRCKSYVKLRPFDATAVICLGDVPVAPLERLRFTGWPQVTAALNGGLPLGKVLLLFAPPGMGKSTLALGLLEGRRTSGGNLFISSEQEAADLVEIGTRCGYDYGDVQFTAQVGVRGVEEAIEDAKPRCIVVDSLQEIARETGLVETVGRLVACARAHAAPMLLTCQVTKDDTWAGPRAVEHLVDGMAELAPVLTVDGVGDLTLTVIGKYRCGPVGRVARLRRLESGRIEEAPCAG
jgi:DNA repair protein RadA/Sms